jgi:hypothetical protein
VRLDEIPLFNSWLPFSVQPTAVLGTLGIEKKEK